MEEAGELEDEDQEPFHSELEFEENEWQEQSTSSKLVFSVEFLLQGPML